MSARAREQHDVAIVGGTAHAFVDDRPLPDDGLNGHGDALGFALLCGFAFLVQRRGEGIAQCRGCFLARRRFGCKRQ